MHDGAVGSRVAREAPGTLSRAVVLAGCVLAVASCGGGGGGGGGPATTTLSGTAAVGAPLTGAVIEVKCRAGSGSGTSDGSGRYAISLSGAQAPCLLKAVGGGTSLVSAVAAASGTANLTPLTHLLAARLFGSTLPVNAFRDAGDAVYALVTEQGIAAAQGQVAAEIVRIGAQMPAVNWVTQSFSAVTGDAMDGALELLATRLAAQNKTLEGAAAELALGPIQVVVPPGQTPGCVPGLIAGFDGTQQDAISRVTSEPNPTGGGDGPGATGGGDGADGVGVGGSLGQFSNVDVTVEFASGAVFGPLRIDSPNGMFTLVPCDLAPPVRVVLDGRPGSGARYFDEHLVAPVSFEGQQLQGILTRLDRNGGVTPFTDAMVRRTLQLGTAVAADGGHRFKAIGKAVDAWKDPARVQVAHDEVLRSVNDLLPGIYRLEDLRRLPVVVGAANSTAGTATLTDNQNGVYGAVLAGLARAAGTLQPGSAQPALEIQKQFANDLVDGVRDLRLAGASVAPGTGGATYDYESLANRLTVATGKVAADLGAGALKTRTTPVQRLRAKSGTTFANTPNWTITLSSDGALQLIRNGGSGTTTPPVLPPGVRIARIDVFDRSTRTYAQTGGSWQNCLVATSADGLKIYTWQVGVAAASFAERVVGTASDPVVSVTPESLSAAINGGDSVMYVRRSGATGTAEGCDQQDFHPGLATSFGGRYVLQVLQDFGNRYVVYSDGTVEAWGIAKDALGVGETVAGSLPSADKKPVLPVSGSGALQGVAMLARGDGIQQTRGLVRSADPALDGAVHVWGKGLPAPRRITAPSLPKACFVAGPYIVGCDGQLFHVPVAVAGGNIAPTVTQVSVPPIWRVSAEFPSGRTTSPANPDFQDENIQVTSLTLSYVAIAQDGTVHRLSGSTATAE